MAVAEDEWALGLLNGRRSGQDPPFLLFGAVHYLLLSGAEHPLGCYYSSVSKDASAPDGGTRAVFSDFCRCYAAELRSLISSKLVQTNVVNRAIALRYALWAVLTPTSWSLTGVWRDESERGDGAHPGAGGYAYLAELVADPGCPGFDTRPTAEPTGTAQPRRADSAQSLVDVPLVLVRKRAR